MRNLAPCLTVSLRLIAGLTVIIAAHGALASEPAMADPFDGRSLAGWMTGEGKPVTQGWEVADGLIHMKPGTPRAGNIVTIQEYGDFTLSFEWRIAPGGNSGIKYWVRPYGKNLLGCEYQIYDDRKKNSQSKHSAGALYDLYEPSAAKQLKPVGEFNTAKIIVHDGHIEHWLNGERIVRATFGDSDWKSRVAASKFNDRPEFVRNSRGKFMLTDHGSEVWFRNFEFEPGP